MLCEYGCGQKATYQFKNGKWCCSESINSCPESKRKNSLLNKGNKHTEESKIKIGKSSKGRVVSEETKRKISIANKGKQGCLGKKHTAETKRKISKSHFGKTHTKETKLKISKTNRGMIPWNKGKRWSYEIKQKISKSKKGKTKVWNKGVELSNEVKEKIHKAKQLILPKIKRKYPTFSKIEQLRYNPNKPGEKEIQVHCKNHNCINSKEKDGWFTPSYVSLMDRIRAIESPLGHGGHFLYCCNECKQECPLYNKSVVQLIKQDQINAGHIKEDFYTSKEYYVWRITVLKRENYLCEYCEEPATDVHHSRPQKLEPGFVLDPDFGIACCRDCHYKYGHKGECSTGRLANIICSETN